jgi:hypothetical protein
MVQPYRPQMIIQYGAEKMRTAYRITKATDPHSQYVIIAFPRQTMAKRTCLNVTSQYKVWLVIYIIHLRIASHTEQE